MEPIHPSKNWLDALASEAAFFRTKSTPSLKVVQALLDALDRPDASFRHRFIIGGTAGKGTLARGLEAALIEGGHTVCTLQSPHLQVLHERIRLNGKLISDDNLWATLAQVQSAAQSHNLTPTYYEALVVAGILAGYAAGCQYLVAEVGLGGQFDAVNAIQGPRSACVTFIGDDHLDHFGGSLTKLAKAKAGIFTPSCVYAVTTEKDSFDVLQKTAAIPVDRVKGHPNNFRPKLTKKLLKSANITPPSPLPRPVLPARWERLSYQDVPLILDGAHSHPRYKYILPKVQRLPGYVLLFGGLADHGHMAARTLIKGAQSTYFTTVPGKRTPVDPELLQKTFDTGQVITNADKAFIAAHEKAAALGIPLLVTGSLYLCGYIRWRVYKPQAIQAQQTEFPTQE